MKTVHDISYLSLFLGYSLLIIPFVILWYYKTGLLKSGIISILRMTIQLFAVGFYLEYIFKLNNSWLNSAWLIVMSIISAQTTIKSCKLSFKLFFIPIFFAGLMND